MITPSAVFRASAILSLRFCNFVAKVSFHLSKAAFRFIAALDKLISFASVVLILLIASDTTIYIYFRNTSLIKFLLKYPELFNYLRIN